MITVFRGTEFVSATIAQMIYTFHQGLEMLARNTGATVTYITATTAELDAIVWAGGAMYFRVVSDYDDQTWNQQTIHVYRGIMSDGQFESKASVGIPNLGGGEPFYPELILINNGDVWDLALHCSENYVGQTYAREYHLRSAHLKASTGEPYYTGGVYSGPPSGKPFPDNDTAGVQYDNLSIQHSKFSYGNNNIPYGSALAFPALIGLGANYPVGVPTINSRVIYDLYGTSIPAYTEFSIGTAAFISLGGVAIRST